MLPSFQDEVVLGRASPKQLYVGITFQQASASGGSDLGVIAELALNLLAAWRCTDLLKAKPSHQLAFSRGEYSL